MEAREFLESVREAQRGIDRMISILDSMAARERVRTQRFDAIGGGSKSGGNRSFADATIARVDYEKRMKDDIGRLRDTVETGRDLCAGVRSANPLHRIWGDVLELRYCEDMKWGAVSRALELSESAAHKAHDAAIEWIDHVGIAAAMEGCGNAAENF